MSKKLLCEYYKLCPDGVCEDLLTEEEKKYVSSGGLILSGVIQRADATNGNGRVYPRKILEREMARYQELIEQNRALGALDHPESEIVELKHASHVMTKVWWDGNEVYGKLRVLNHTPDGKTLGGLIKDGITLGISSRGLGSVRETREGVIVEDDFQLVAFDVVGDPSTHGAFLVKEHKEKGLYKLTKREIIRNLLEEILSE